VGIGIIFSLYTQTLLPTSNSSLLQKKKKTTLSRFTDSRRHIKLPPGVVSVATYMYGETSSIFVL
jgi:hypothetical protein